MLDHVAVDLFQTHKFAGLELHFPCPWDAVHHKYLDTGEPGRRNPGRAANRYHTEFSASAEKDSFADLLRVQHKGAVVHIHRGFFARNTLVAKSDALLAFTWSTSTSPLLKSGTMNTWKQARNMRTHVSLASL